MEEIGLILLEAYKHASRKVSRLASGQCSRIMYAVPPKVQKGDLVCLLNGCAVPAIVRPDGNVNRYLCDAKVVVDAGVDDIMKYLKYRNVNII